MAELTYGLPILIQVPVIPLTPFRHKRHIQFLTSAPNFRGSADPLRPGRREPLCLNVAIFRPLRHQLLERGPLEVRDSSSVAARVISRGARGNDVPVVEKLPERMGTTYPLLTLF